MENLLLKEFIRLGFFLGKQATIMKIRTIKILRETRNN